MVHRREAFHVGEFRMVGVDNAKFWSSQVAQSGGEHDLPQKELKARVQELAKQYQTDDGSVQEWGDKIADSGQLMNHRATHDLAMTVLRQRDNGHDELRDLAEHVIESEIRILLYHALQRAEFEVDKDYLVSQKQVKPKG